MVWTLINQCIQFNVGGMIIWWIRLMHWVGAVVVEMIEVFNDRAIYYIICLMMSSNQIWKVVPSISWCWTVGGWYGGGELCVWHILFELLTRFFIFSTISMNLGWVLCDDGSLLEWTKSVSQKQWLRKLCQNFAFAWNRVTRIMEFIYNNQPPRRVKQQLRLMNQTEW